MNQIVRKIHLYGQLKEMCGGQDVVELVGDNLRMIASGLSSMFGEGVKQFIRDNNWHIVRDTFNENDLDSNAGKEFTTETIEMKLGNLEDIHIYPAVEGSGRALQIIVGIVLIVAGYFLLWTPFGAPMIMAGIGLILSAVFAPKMPGQQEKPDERASFTFNGPVNTMGQGGPVPLVYGRFRTGSAVVSAGINAEQLMTYTSPPEGDAVNNINCIINPAACATP